MFKFIIWCILIYTVSRFVIRVFGKSILSIVVNRLAVKMQQDIQNKQDNYQRYQEPGAFKKSVLLNEDVHVTEPTHKAEKAPPKATDFAEDIEFEDVT